MQTIDLTPSWGEWGNLFYLFASKGEVKLLEPLRRDFAMAMAIAEAFNNICSDLTDGQRAAVRAVMSIEMRKQGFELE